MSTARIRRFQSVVLRFLTVALLLTVSSETVFAADPKPSEKIDYSKPIILMPHMQKHAENLGKDIVEAAKNPKETRDRGYLLEGVMSNSWIITRSVVNGFGDVDDIVAWTRNTDTLKTFLLEDAAQKVKARQMMGENYTMTDDGVYVMASTMVEAERDGKLKRILNFGNELEKLGKLGILSGGRSMFDKTQLIAGILLSVTFMGKVMFMAYEQLVKESPPPLAWFRILFKYIALVFIIIYLDEMIMHGISLSDSVRDTFSKAAFGDGGESAGEIVAKLLKVKVDMLGIEQSASLLDFFSKTGTMVLAQLLGWLSYFIASAVLFVIVLLGDVMMSLAAVLGPVICAMSMLPTCEDSLAGWFKGYITLLFYGPLAAVYSILLVAIMAVGIDTSALAFIVVTVSYIIGATKIPDMAKNLSGTVLAGLAIGIASAPAKFAAGALSGAAKAAGGAIAR